MSCCGKILELNLVKIGAGGSKFGMDTDTDSMAISYTLPFIQFEWGLTLDGCCELERHFILSYVKIR